METSIIKENVSMHKNRKEGEVLEKVKFIVGRSGAGKTRICYDAIKAHLQETTSYEPLMLLVPEQFNLQNQRDLAKYLSPGLLRAEVMSFNTLAREVFREVGKEQVTVIEDLERMIILKRLIEVHKKEIVFYKKSIHNIGFLEAMNRFITVLEQAGMTVGHLDELKKQEAVGVLFESKLSDIETIYQSFQTYLGERYVTIEKNMTMLAHLIAKSKRLEKTSIWIDGFYGFTHTQLLIISELIKKAKDVTITLPMDKAYHKTEVVRLAHPFYESIQMLQKLMGICDEVKVPYEVSYIAPDEKVIKEKKPALIYLEENYLKRYQIAYDKPQESIYLATYSSRRDEVEAAARKIVSLVRDEGYRYHDMALIVGDLTAYQTILASTFKEYEIPYFLDMNRNIHTNSLVAVIEGVLGVLTESYSYESIMHLLRTYMLPLSKEAIDELENYLLAYGIKGKKKWQMEWTFETTDEEKQARINATREKILAPISRLEEELQSVKRQEAYQVGEETRKRTVYSVVGVTTALYHFLEDIAADQTMLKIVEKNRQQANRLLELENTQMWPKVMEVFERLVDILGEDEKEGMDLRTYKNVLETSFSYIKMGIIPPANDQVLIGSVERTRLPRVKACFILGTNEGLIPKVEETSTIFSDMDKATLGQICERAEGPQGRLGDLMIQQPIYGNAFTIYTVLTRSSQKLFMSAALADENGKLLRPSMVYFKLKKMFKEKAWFEGDSASILQAFEKPLPAYGYVGGMLRNYLEGRDTEEVWKDAMSWFKSHKAWSERMERLTDYLFYSNQQHYLDPETTKLLYGDSLKTSITQLENFRQCACCYFMRYGIKAEERRLFNFDSAKVGTLFHAALEQYPKELERLGTNWVKATSKEQHLAVKNATDYAMSRVGSAQKETGRFKFTTSKVEKMTTRAVRALTSHLQNGAFTPEGYEIGFGEGMGFPAIEIDLEEGRKLLIRGQIDRVDVFYRQTGEQYVKILDYKSGQKKFDLLEVYYGLQLQLLLYLDAYLEKHPESQAAGVFYFHINNPYISYKVGMSEEDIADASLKQFKLSGIALADEEILKALDRSQTGSTIAVSFNKDGSIRKNSSVASEQQFKALESYIIETIRGLGQDILSGKVSTKPYRLNGKNPCEYCKYHTICQFNEEMPDNCYEELDKLSKEQIWQAIEKEEN